VNYDAPANVKTAASPRSIAGRPRLGLEETLATARHRRGALAVCVVLAVLAVAAIAFARVPGPRVAPFVPICATVWSIADLLTAFLLLAQFYVKGTKSFGIVAVAYGLSALFTWPYLAYFPGTFGSAPSSLADQQISPWLWMIWHLTFPLLILVASLEVNRLGGIVSKRKVSGVMVGIIAATVLLAVTGTALVIALRFSLPHLVLSGAFQPLFTRILIPIAIGLNVLTCLALFRSRPFNAISLWLAVALFSESVDLLLSSTGVARYTYSWDVGKLVTVTTASIVLIMMLCDIVGLYGRLASIARTDPLTSLPNRRAFEEHFEFVLNNARRLHGSMGLLVIDIDFFKTYNDAHGHLAGDECLRRVSRELSASAGRPLDLVARYGGEEFVVALPDTSLRGVLDVAERIRARIEALRFTASKRENRGVTVSIGVSYVRDAAGANDLVLFETADHALYGAKEHGRNQVQLGEDLAVPLSSIA
jgi:diguanylate cyclase (GGDEF)-like protein